MRGSMRSTSALTKALAISFLCLFFLYLPIVSDVLLASESPIPMNVIRPCLPPTPSHLPGRYRFELVGYATAPTGKYESFYLLDVHRPWESEDYPWTTLIGVERGSQRCFNFLGQDAADVTLTAYAPLEVARSLSLQRFDHWLSTRPEWGRSRIEALLSIEDSYSADDPTSPTVSALAPEDAWALRSLGYRIPPEMYILPVLSPYYEEKQ